MKHKAIYALYDKAVSINEDGDNITVYNSSGKKISITDWDAVDTKAAELQKEADDAEAKRKTDKLSAYRKLSMTDDEIRAIDPTLLEE